MTQLDSAWNDYFLRFADDLEVRWDRSKQAYLGLKDVRSILGKPFYKQPSGGGGDSLYEDPGAWDESLDKNVMILKDAVPFISMTFREAAAGKRQVKVEKGGEFSLEALPTDPFQIVSSEQGGLSLVKPDGTEHVPSGNVGVPWVALAIAAVAVTAAQAYVAVKALEALETLAEQKTQQTLVQSQTELVTSGKATPEQAKAMTDAVLKGTEAIEKAKTEKELAKKTSPEQWSGLVKTIGTVGVILLIAYLGVKYLPQPKRAHA